MAVANKMWQTMITNNFKLQRIPVAPPAAPVAPAANAPLVPASRPRHASTKITHPNQHHRDVGYAIHATPVTGRVLPNFTATNTSSDDLQEIHGPCVCIRSRGGTGYAKESKFEIDGTDGVRYTVKGDVPVVDKNFIYHLKCRKTWINGQPVWYIVQLMDPFVVPLPIKGTVFRTALKQHAKMSIGEATRIAKTILTPFMTVRTGTDNAKLESVELAVSQLMELCKDYDWYKPLGDKWQPFRWSNLPTLSQLWSHDLLQKLTLEDMNAVVESLRTRPIIWFLKEYTQTSLNFLPLSYAAKVASLFGKALTAEEECVIRFYNAIVDSINDTQSLEMGIKHLWSLPVAGIDMMADDPEWNQLHHQHRPLRDQAAKTVLLGKMALLSKNAMAPETRPYPYLVRVYNPLTQEETFFRRADYIDIMYLQTRLGSLVCSNEVLTPKPTARRFNLGNSAPLFPEQQVGFDDIRKNQNVLILHGPPGCGKTHVGGRIAGEYLNVICLAMTAAVARRMEDFSGNAMTVDLLLERVRYGVKLGKQLSVDTEVLLADEIGQWPLRKFAAVLRALPNLKKVVMLGDLDQCRPISPGRILMPLFTAWRQTPLVCHLYQNRRVELDSALLIDNFKAFLEGRLAEIQYSNDLTAPHPMHIVQRAYYPRSVLNLNEAESNARLVDILKKELMPIRTYLLERGANMSSLRIFTLRAAYVDLLNRAWWELEFASMRRRFDPKVFYVGSLVTFQENYNGNPRSSYRGICETTRIDHNATTRIAEIFDINPRERDTDVAMHTRVIRNNTAVERTNDSWVRMIVFENGTRVNLAQYPLKNLKYGYASTIHSSQGCEADNVIVYVHPNFRHFYREHLYTAMTRPRRQLIIDCDLRTDFSLERSEIGDIFRNVQRTPPNYLHRFIPKPGDVLVRTVAADQAADELLLDEDAGLEFEEELQLQLSDEEEDNQMTGVEVISSVVVESSGRQNRRTLVDDYNFLPISNTQTADASDTNNFEDDILNGDF